MRLHFELTLGSDYHVGAGHGLGSQVDSALLRDGDRLPVLRGSTLEGLLRDGLWRLLQLPLLESHYRQHRNLEEQARQEGAAAIAVYCTEPDQGPTHCPLCRVFGTPAAPKRWRVSSARPGGVSVPLYDSKWQAGRTGAQVAARVRINPRTRRAEARKLFQQEEGDARLAFRFTIDGPDDERSMDEAALLVAAGRMVRRLGSARRRGRGACRLHLIRVESDTVLPAGLDTEDSLLAHFKGWLEKAERPVITPAPRTWLQSETSGTEPIRWRAVLRLNEPVLIALRAQAGNTFDTLDYIPGGVLLGALASEAAVRWGLAKADPKGSLYQTFVDLFRGSAITCSMLYPARNDDNIYLFPTIPAPLDLLTCKVYRGLKDDLNHHGVRGYAATDEPPKECPRCGHTGHPDIPLVHYGGFLSVEGQMQEVKVQRREELHPRVDPYTQRVATGNLFGYVALESGQWFLGELRCRDEGVWQAFCELADVTQDTAVTLRLGKATRRGHGLATLWLKDFDRNNLDPWRGKLLEQRVIMANDSLTLTLLTDAILPDSWGRCYQTLEDETLLQRLIGEPVQVKQPFCKAGYVDGFNAHLGLPRWRDIVLRAGSAIGLRLTPPTGEEQHKQWLASLLQRLRKLEDNGIGLRRHEGFGQVVFNHPVYKHNAEVENTGIKIPETSHEPPKESVTAILQAEQIELERWERKLAGGRLEKALTDSKTFAKEKDRKKWAAIARWLHTASIEPIAQLQKNTLRFGNPGCLTDVNREPKEGAVFKEIDRILAHLDEAAKQLGKKAGVSGLNEQLQALRGYIERFYSLEEAREQIDAIQSDPAAKPALKELKKVGDLLKRLEQSAALHLHLNDCLVIADKALSARLRRIMIERLADRLAAAVKEAEQ